MSFITILESSQSEWAKLRFSEDFRFACTSLRGHTETIYSLPAIALDELEQRQISYHEVAEERLSDLLTRQANGILNHMRHQNPDWPEEVQILPAPGHIEIQFQIDSMFESRIREILLDYSSTDIEVSDLAPLVIANEDQETHRTDQRDTRHIRACIPAAKFDPLFEYLAQAGLAGYSRETIIIRSGNPDHLPS